MHHQTTTSSLRTPLVLLACICTSAMASAQDKVDQFDGLWNVSVTCADIKDKGSLVKGYTLTFQVNVRGGQLEGEYTRPGAPETLRYSGTIQADGKAHIKATGKTGDPGHSVGHVAPGRPYTYQLDGTFAGNTGQAVRRELRPCTASFTKTL